MRTRPVIATVDSAIRFHAKDLHPKSMERLWRDLTFPNPEYINRVRFNKWVGATPEEIYLIESDGNDVLSIPRGAVRLLQDAVAVAGDTVSFVDQRVLHPPVDFNLSFTLRDYQNTAAIRLARGVQGCAVIPCGGGKTVVGMGVIAKLRQPAIILVHTTDLLEQWQSTIRDAFGIEPGAIADGKVQLEVITVAMVQTLTNLDEPALTQIGQRFGVVIQDEAHHTPATVFRSILSAFAGKYRFGLTATPDRADGLSVLLELCIGPMVFQIGHQQLVDGGHLIIPEVAFIETGCTPSGETHAAVISELVKNHTRNGLIVALAAHEANQGRTVLILSGRVDHCGLLAKKLKAKGVSVEALTGKVPKTKRTDILERFKSGALSVVCATSLADEGLDVSRLERLILATPAKAEGRTIQRLGRLMRPHPLKETPILYDLVDSAPMTRKQQAARRRAYKKVLGKDAPGICSGQNLACAWDESTPANQPTYSTGSR
ncbi:MAG: DEAD/DEAH box helicase [Deltaproteobacteria bacterium]|nr:DEAD/DEAH box helicase [Deltaproteobacteria bacterium]